jgi:hypothetical protein
VFLRIDEPVAEVWARLSVPDPLPLVDGLLAATAKVHGLVTRDVVHLPEPACRFSIPS